MKPYGKWDAFIIGCANAVLHLASDRCRLTIGALVQQGMTCADRHPPLPDTTPEAQEERHVCMPRRDEQGHPVAGPCASCAKGWFLDTTTPPEEPAS